MRLTTRCGTMINSIFAHVLTRFIVLKCFGGAQVRGFIAVQPCLSGVVIGPLLPPNLTVARAGVFAKNISCKNMLSGSASDSWIYLAGVGFRHRVGSSAEMNFPDLWLP